MNAPGRGWLAVEIESILRRRLAVFLGSYEKFTTVPCAEDSTRPIYTGDYLTYGVVPVDSSGIITELSKPFSCTER